MARINRRPSANRRSTLTKETPVGPEVNDPFDPNSAGFEIRMEDPSFRAKLDEHFMSMGPPSFTPEPVEEPWTRPPPIEMMGSSFSPAPIRKGSGKMFSERPGLATVRESMAEEAEAARLLGTGVAGASTSSMRPPGFKTGGYFGGFG